MNHWAVSAATLAAAGATKALTIAPPETNYGIGREQLVTRALSGPSVAIVGARRASSYGRDVAFAMARNLADDGFTIVSDLRLGIGGSAARGALGADRSGVIGVLPSGPDHCSPPSHRRLYEQIVAQHAVISPQPPRSSCNSERSAARLELVLALSSIVVVVEAAAASVDVARYAELTSAGRLCAVPGPVSSPLAVLPNALLHDGSAELVRDASDICTLFDRIECSRLSQPNPDDERRQVVLSALAERAFSLPELATRSGLALAALSLELLELERSGLVLLDPRGLHRLAPVHE